MKFKNYTKENKKYRLGSMKDCIWKTARPGETVDIPEHIGDQIGLKKIQEEIVEEKNDSGSSKDSEESTNPGDFRETEEFKKFLISIKGVGKKSTEDILNKYHTEKELIISMKENPEEDVHKNDKIDNLVKKAYEL